ncbi:MAG: hypothetical protein ACYCS8_13340 [Acidithiobacillus sp.]
MLKKAMFVLSMAMLSGSVNAEATTIQDSVTVSGKHFMESVTLLPTMNNVPFDIMQSTDNQWSGVRGFVKDIRGNAVSYRFDIKKSFTSPVETVTGISPITNHKAHVVLRHFGDSPAVRN